MWVVGERLGAPRSQQTPQGPGGNRGAGRSSSITPVGRHLPLSARLPLVPPRPASAPQGATLTPKRRSLRFRPCHRAQHRPAGARGGAPQHNAHERPRHSTARRRWHWLHVPGGEATRQVRRSAIPVAIAANGRYTLISLSSSLSHATRHTFWKDATSGPLKDLTFFSPQQKSMW